ncbi:MAG: hypothetical protein QY325_10700 [Flavobacteriales bacterium]|jgi:hypothetical protein|nr:MAG: hypothetical protein QY325_10700 [Flavobacteriales bacterium]
MLLGTFRRPVAAFTMAALLLLGTSGVALSRMTCLMGGHSVVSVGMADDCCPEQDGTGGMALSADCCAYTQAGGDRPDALQSQMPELALPVEVSDAVAVVPLPLTVNRPWKWLDSRPPPHDAPGRLARLRVRLV